MVAVPFIPVFPVTIAQGIVAFGWLVGIYMFGVQFDYPSAGMCCGSVEVEPLYTVQPQL